MDGNGNDLTIIQNQPTEISVESEKDSGYSEGNPPAKKPGRKNTQKKRRQQKKAVADEKAPGTNRWGAYRHRLRTWLGKFSRQRHFLSSYQQDLWDDKIRPEKELEKSRQKLKDARAGIFQVLKDVNDANSDCKRFDNLKEDEDGMIDIEDVACSRCGKIEIQEDNDIILCDFKGCYRAYHLKCLVPPLASSDLGEGDWFCHQCECMMDCLETINEVLDTDFDDWSEVLQKWSDQDTELDGDAPTGRGLGINLDDYNSEEDDVFNPDGSDDEEEEENRESNAEEEQEEEEQVDQEDRPLNMNDFLKSPDSAEDGSVESSDEGSDLEDFDSDVNELDAEELGALSDAGSISDDEEMFVFDEEVGEKVRRSTRQRGGKNRAAGEMLVGKKVLKYSEEDEKILGKVTKFQATQDEFVTEVVTDAKTIESNNGVESNVNIDQQQSGEWTIQFEDGSSITVDQGELDELRGNHKEYRQEQRLEKLEEARRILEEKGKLDNNNILTGKRRRANIDYHKLSMALFGDIHNEEIDDPLDWNSRATGKKRGRKKSGTKCPVKRKKKKKDDEDEDEGEKTSKKVSSDKKSANNFIENDSQNSKVEVEEENGRFISFSI